MSFGLPPQVELIQALMGYQKTQVFAVVASLGVADEITRGRSTVEELAEATGAQAGALSRLLRTAASLGLLEVGAGGTYGLTKLGECLRSDAPGSLRHFAWLNGADQYRMWGALERSVRTGEPQVVETLGKPFYEHVQDNPQALEVYNRAMAEIARFGLLMAIAAYDFSTARRVVDVGGGSGTLLCHLLGAHPHLEGVLFDRPETEPLAREAIAAEGLSERCEFIGGDFFEVVPSGGDLYLMALILHGFDDGRARELLGKVRAVIPDEGRLLVLEGIVSESPGPDQVKLNDLTMLVTIGGRERTEAELRALLGGAGFHLERVLPSMTPMRALVAAPA